MCQSGCSHENYYGDCTLEENNGFCPLLIAQEEERKIIWLNNNLVEGYQKCKDCMFTHLCDCLTDNYKEDICQVIQKKFEDL